MKRTIAPLALVLSALVLAACGTPGNNPYGASRTDQDFGHSVREARARQTIDVDACSKHAGHAGTDAQSAVLSMERYRETQKTPPPTFNVLEIGTRR